MVVSRISRLEGHLLDFVRLHLNPFSGTFDFVGCLYVYRPNLHNNIG
jgi:hypothetical protein